jgi:glucan phosphoethanolaminetransferase (alkaline phosphatase superfamily)
MFRNSKNNNFTFLLASLLVYIVNCQTTSGRIGGIGVGTFIIIIAIAFSVVWCLACRSSSYPEIYSIIGVAIPIILILIFIFMPK